MRKVLFATLLAAVAGSALPLMTGPASAQAQHATPHSVESTLIGKLIDDPAAAAVLRKLIPAVWANELFHTTGRNLTLKAIQQFEAELTDQKLAEIQAEFDKIAAEAGRQRTAR